MQKNHSKKLRCILYCCIYVLCTLYVAEQTEIEISTGRANSFADSCTTWTSCRLDLTDVRCMADKVIIDTITKSVTVAATVAQILIMRHKKLIRRWDNERELFYDDMFNHFYAVRTGATEFGKITQNKGHYAVQGHSKSPILVPIESLYATSYLWVILTYLLILHCFRDIAFDRSKIAIFGVEPWLMARWKARIKLPIRHNLTFFR